jgi:hypothetical protein
MPPPGRLAPSHAVGRPDVPALSTLFANLVLDELDPELEG